MRLLLVLPLLFLPGAVMAEMVTDPDWPCIQRKQPQLSLAQVWAGPPPDEAVTELAKDPAVQHLARVLALRRTGLDEAEVLIKDYAKDADAPHLTAVYLATFEQIQRARDRVMGGITRYAHKQAVLDAHIKSQRDEFDRLMAVDAPDFDAVDKVELDIDWSTRIFQDRQQSLTYVCETPVILEQRAFALGRIIAGQLKK